MFLVDTNVVSALRRSERHPTVARWMAAQRTSDVYLSVMTIGEIERGIARVQRRDPPFAHDLSIWLNRVLGWYGERILPADLAVARRWGPISAAIGHKNTDLLIAATALEHGLTVVTRNVSDFEPTGVPVLNPFE